MAFSAPTVTFVSAGTGGQTNTELRRDIRDRLTGQTTGMQNLGTLKDSANQLAAAIYDVSANVVYVVPL